MSQYWSEDPMLMIPGPSELHPRVRQVLMGRFYPHYGPEWGEIYWGVEEAVRKIFRTKNEVIVMPGPGSLGLELGIVNVANRGDKVIALTNGFFGDRFAEIASYCAAEVVTLSSPPGYIVSTEVLKECLDKHPDAVALLAVQNESATGILNPIRQFTEIAKKRGLFTVVDSISAFGGAELDVDGWGIDVCVGYPNKCLSGVPGALPVSISSEVWEKVERGLVRPNSWMTNLRVWKWYRKNWASHGHPYPTTVNTYAYLALKVAAEVAIEEGLERRYERHRRVAAAFRAAMKTMGLGLVSKNEEYASPTITAIELPPDLQGKIERIVEKMLRDYRIMISRGIAATEDTAIRVGHMGYTASPRFLIPTLSALYETLRSLDYQKCSTGDAIEAFYEELRRPQTK
ncbi:MAG: aminotransferase class V-fold PLP-dependent enzyme [Nitrososphaerota archaeon]